MWDVYLYFVLLAVNAVLFIANYPHLKTELRVLGAAILCTLLLEGYAAFLMFQKIPNMHIYRVLIPIQYMLFTLIYYQTITNRRIKKYILLSIPIYLLVVLWAAFVVQKANQFNSYALAMHHILLAGWVLFYYRELFTQLKVVRLTSEPMFWVSAGLLFYSLGSFFADGLMNYLIRYHRELANKLYFISVILSCFLYILFIIAFTRKNVPIKAQNQF